MPLQLDELEKFKLKRLIETLKNKRGRGTELISIYIPAGRRLDEIVKMLREEYSQAQNIKDRTTRHHVLEALATIIQRLKMLGYKPPPNGLVIFCGYIDTGIPGREEKEVYLIEPPQPLKVWLYRCDSKFHTEILEDMIKEKDVYGIIVIDLSEATFAILRGKNIQILKTITSGVLRKHHKGGQSQRRFQRIREHQINEYFKRVAEYAKEYFLPLEKDLKGIVIGGPGPAKQDFYSGDYLDYRLKNKVIGLVDLCYTGEEGVFELLKRGADVLKESKYIREQQLIDKLMKKIIKEDNLVAYGEKEVLEMLNYGAVDTLLIYEKLPDKIVEAQCTSCGYRTNAKIKKESEKYKLQCPKCKIPLKILSEKPLLDLLIELAEKTGAKVELISDQSEAGVMFIKTFGGIAAFLRYNPKR